MNCPDICWPGWMNRTTITQQCMTMEQEFDNYGDFQGYVERISADTFSIFVIKDSKTVEAANKRLDEGSTRFHEKFKYAYLRLTCKHYGEARSSKSCGKRPNQRTFKTGCTAFVKASVDRKRNKLVIIEQNLNHNHDTNEELFSMYPESRRPSEVEKTLINQLSGLNVPPGTIAKHIADLHGKRLSAKDIQNIRQKNKEHNELDDVLKVLEEFCKENSQNTVIIEHENGTISGIFLQSAEQKKMIDQFPEVLHLDGTYRVNNRRMPLYVVMVEDGNGKGAAVAYALLANERKESIFFFLNTLLKTNPLVKDLATCFIVDKDFTQINVIESLFSKAQVILCRFHVLKTFRLETTKLKITDDQRNTIRSILQSLVYSTSGDKYQESLEKLEKIATQGFIQYFTDNWDNCRRMWAGYLTSAVKNFSTKTNNRLERHNQEVKKTLNSHISVAVCLRKLIKCNNQCIARREYDLFSNTVCSYYNVLDSEEVVFSIRATATPYAATATIKQFTNAMELDKDSVRETCDNIYRVGEHTCSFENSTPTCTCTFFCSMSLPCKHIFSVLHVHNIPFSEDWIASRWRKSYNYQVPSDKRLSLQTTLSVRVPTKLSRNEKFVQFKTILMEIAGISSEICQEEFDARYEQMLMIRNAWVEGKNTHVIVEDTENDPKYAGIKLPTCAQPSDSTTEPLKNISTESPMTDMKAESLADLSTEQSTYNKSLTDLKTEDMSRSPPLTDLSPEPLIVTGVQNPQTDDGKGEDNDLPKTVKILNQKEQVGKSCWPTVQPKGCHISPFGVKFSKLRRKKKQGTPADKSTKPNKYTQPQTDSKTEPPIVTLVQKRQIDDVEGKDTDLMKKPKILHIKEQETPEELHLPTVRKVRGRPKGCNTSIAGVKFSKLKKKKTDTSTEPTTLNQPPTASSSEPTIEISTESPLDVKNKPQTDKTKPSVFAQLPANPKTTFRKIPSRSKTSTNSRNEKKRKQASTDVSLENFKTSVCNFKEGKRLHELLEFLSTLHMVPPRHAVECVKFLQTGYLPPTNSIGFEASKLGDKLDIVMSILTENASALIKNVSFEKKTDIFQLLMGTVLVAAENELNMAEVKEMFKIPPSHLRDELLVAPAATGKLRVGNTSFTHKDFGSLRQGKWLNDQIIHAYLNLLMQEHHGKVYMLPSFLGLKWECQSYDEWLYSKVDFAQFRWIMMPVFKNNHWLLLTADTLNSTICILNSLDDAKVEQDFFKHWCKFIQTRNQKTAFQLPDCRKVTSKSGQQYDSHSCGVFVLMNAEALLCGVNPAVMRQHHAAWYRKYIKRRLLKNSRSNKDSMCDMPFCRKPSRSQFLQWVQCDTCNRWCHTECVNLSIVPRGSFYCVLCIS